MIEENYLNLKSCSRLSEETMSFIVEGQKFEFIIDAKSDNFDLTIKDLTTNSNYLSKKNIADFLKNELFKTSHNSQTVKETIFKMVINSYAKILFAQNKCVLLFNSKNSNSKETAFPIEFMEEINVTVIIQLLKKKSDELEKENRLMKIEFEKIKNDFISMKEEKNKEIKELKESENERKSEIFGLRKELEKLNSFLSANKVIPTNYINTNLSSGNNFYPTTLEDNKLKDNFLNTLSNSLKNKESEKLMKNDSNSIENRSNNNISFEKPPLPNRHSSNINESRSSKGNFIKIPNENLIENRNDKTGEFPNREKSKTPLSDSPPISIKKQVEELKENHFLNMSGKTHNSNREKNNHNNINYSPLINQNEANIENLSNHVSNHLPNKPANERMNINIIDEMHNPNIENLNHIRNKYKEREKIKIDQIMIDGNINPLFTFSNNTPKILNEGNVNLQNLHLFGKNNYIYQQQNQNNRNQTNIQHLGKNELLNFLTINPTDTPQQYRFTNLLLRKPISNFKLENNIKYFFQANKGEISDTTLWTPFDEEECILLELHYPNYLIGGPAEILLEKMNKVVNFKYMMLVDAENSENHIHVKRALPHKVENVIRRNRFNFDEVKSENFLKNRIIPNLNILKEFGKYSEYFSTFEFNFIKNHSFDVKIPKKFEYLYKECIKRSNYGGFVVSLREEVENLRKLNNKKTSIFLDYLDNLENSAKFFQIIIQMYTEDGFLNSELNRVLRKSNLENLDKIKYFYLSVLTSLTFCSLNVRPKSDSVSPDIIASRKTLQNSGKKPEENFEYITKTEVSYSNLPEKQKDKEKEGNDENANMNQSLNSKTSPDYQVEKNLFIYSPYKLSSEELEFYANNRYNIIHFDEFISATPNKTKAENYLKAFKNFNIMQEREKEKLRKTQNDQISQNNIEAILEIEIPYYMLESENIHIDTLAFTYDENFSLFPQDEEVILKSGTIFLIKEIVRNVKEVYKFTVKLVALSFSWKGFFDGLAYNHNTREINLNKNSIGNFRKSVKYLCEALVKNNNIEKLSLRENHFGDNFESMKYLANLISITNLSNNQLQNEIFTENAILSYYNSKNQNGNLIINSIPKLKILDLANNSIGKIPQIAKIFCEAIQINQNISQIDLSFNNFNDIESAKYLSSALICNKILEKIDLSSNNLGLNLLAANYLSEAFLINKQIQFLNISDNNLGERPDIVKSLFESISRNKSLTRINLSGNSFGINSISVRYLCEGLILNEGIFELNLNNNLLGNLESLTYLCALLEKNENLEILDLGKNKFGVNKESYTLLGEAISKSKKIHTLNLMNNNLNTHSDYLGCLLDSIALNSCLKKVNFSYNSLSNNDEFKIFVKNISREKNINYVGTTEI